MNYMYKDPRENGYVELKLTKEQHNILFKNRQMDWKSKYEYYLSDKYYKVHQFRSLRFKLLTILLFPINMIYAGISNFGELMDEYSDLFHEKERGKFISDGGFSDSTKYKELKKILDEGKL